MKKVIKVLMFVWREKNGRKEFFVLHRKKGDCVVLTGHVGDIFPDESLKQAVEREIKEELGVETKNIIDLNIAIPVEMKEKNEYILSAEHAFLVQIPNNKGTHFLEGDEEHKWYLVEELSKVLTYSNQKEPLKKIKEILKNKQK